jgi:hypothetical protein
VGVHGALALEGEIEGLAFVGQLANLLVLHASPLQLAQQILFTCVLLRPTNLLLRLLQRRLALRRFGRQWGVSLFGVS